MINSLSFNFHSYPSQRRSISETLPGDPRLPSPHGAASAMFSFSELRCRWRKEESGPLGEGFSLARPRSSDGTSAHIPLAELIRLAPPTRGGGWGMHCRWAPTATYLDFVKYCPGQRDHVFEPEPACGPPVWNFLPALSLKVRTSASKSPDKSLMYTETNVAPFTQSWKRISIWKSNHFFTDQFYNFREKM